MLHTMPCISIAVQSIFPAIELTRIIHEASTAAADTGMPTALRSVGFLALDSAPTYWQVRLRNPPVARLVAMPVCAADR